MSGFSNFLTNFSGGSINSSSGTDLMSKAIIVPSFNTALHHANDGFIYLSNLLIQFSATSVSTTNGYLLTKDNNYSVYYPINFNPLCVQVSPIFNGGGNSSNVCFQNLTTNNYFLIRITNNDGNLNWISISLAPTTPIYTSIQNASTNVTITNATSVYINGTGDKQCICNSSNIVYINSKYGYGNWGYSTLPTSAKLSKIVGSLDGNTLICSNNNGDATGNYYSTNFGVNFSKIDMPSSDQLACNSIACNQDASIIYATSNISNAAGGYIFKSLNKATFTRVHYFMNNPPYDVATDVTGQYIYIAAYLGRIHISRDFGNNWGSIGVSSSLSANKITINSTGQYSAATIYNGGIYITKDYWINFTKSNAPDKLWSSITSNSTGQYLSATTRDTNDGIYYSIDYGMNWVTNVPNNDYVSINMNSNGNIATAITSSSVYVSFNASN